MSLAPHARFGRYELLGQLGAGGMGEVYRARDHDLHREVAIKFLPERFSTDQDRLERFFQEARAASSLNHPNIITIHEIGSTGGLSFIVMELIEGQTLRQAIQGRPMPARRVLDIATQLADGLAKAHAAGIVHRDLKPENVMVTRDGFVKILDFGLAKLKNGDRGGGPPGPSGDSDSTADTVLPPNTRRGVIVGTPGYMSPEQVTGRTVDYRSDQFVFGAIVHEMATGRAAFRRQSTAETMSAIIGGEPDSLASVTPTFPAPARWAVERCLSKDPGDRYASTLDLARELHSLREHFAEASASGATTPGAPTPLPFYRRWQFALLAAATLAGVLLLPPVRDAVVGRLWRAPLPSELRVVVLPIQARLDPGGDPGGGTGLFQYVVARLGELQQPERRLSVVPAVDVLQAGVASPAAAGRSLGATIVVTASVERVRDRVLVATNLVDPTQPGQLRSATRNLAAAEFTVDALVDAIVGMLDLEAGSGARVSTAGGTSVAEAAMLYTQALGKTPYQQAQFALERYDQEQSLAEAVSLLQRALTLDPRFALAHAGLGRAHYLLFQLNKDPEHVTLAVQHCERAVAIDGLFAQAWITLGSIHAQMGQKELAAQEFRRALARDPLSSDAHRELGMAYQRAGMPDEAEASFRKAIELDRRSWANHNYYGWFLWRHQRFGEAERAFKAALEAAPDNARVWSNLGGVYFAQNRTLDAEAAFRKSSELGPTGAALSNLATLQYYRGQFAEAARSYERATSIVPRDYRLWRNLAATYSRLEGEQQKAEGAYRQAARLAQEQRKVDPMNGELAADLADCYAMLRQAAEARTMVAEALRLAPGDARVLTLVAAALEELGDRRAALRHVESALVGGCPREDIERERTFVGLIQDPAYKALLKRLESRPK